MNWATLIFLTQSFDSKIAFNFLLFWHFQVIRVGDKHFLSSLCPRLHSLHSLEENILSRNVSSITTMHFHETHFTDYNLATCMLWRLTDNLSAVRSWFQNHVLGGNCTLASWNCFAVLCNSVFSEQMSGPVCRCPRKCLTGISHYSSGLLLWVWKKRIE